MKMKWAVGLASGCFVVGSVLAAEPRVTFESTRAGAIKFHASVISGAAPQVRARVSASAAAFRRYLAGCGRNCRLYQFLSEDLRTRFKRVSERELHLLMTLVFAEATADMTDLKKMDMQNTLQDYQRAVETISNVAREESDDAKKILGNLRD